MRRLLIALLTLIFAAVPAIDAHAAAPPAASSSAAQPGPIARTAAALAVDEAARLSAAQSSVTPRKDKHLVLALIAGAAVVTGVGLVAYGASDACKAKHNPPDVCDRYTIVGALGVTGGTVALVIWGLSR